MSKAVLVLELALAAGTFWSLQTQLAVYGQKTEAHCPSNYSLLENTLGQSPCLVASYLLGACQESTADIPALNASNPKSVYPFPGEQEPEGSFSLEESQCTCSSVFYSLLAACAWCQTSNSSQLRYSGWNNWVQLCQHTFIVSDGFPSFATEGTVVPTWACRSVTELGGWDPTGTVSAIQEENATENAPSTCTAATAAMSPVNSVPTTSLPNNSSSNSTPIGAIVGGVIGGLFAVGLIIIAIAYVRNMVPKSTSVSDVQPSRPSHRRGPSLAPTVSSMATLESPTMTMQRPLKLYNPDDPSTHPPPVSEINTYRSGRSDRSFTAVSPSSAARSLPL